MTSHDPEQGCGLLLLSIAVGLAAGLIVAIVVWLRVTG